MDAEVRREVLHYHIVDIDLRLNSVNIQNIEILEVLR
jgi:hypothetical protein